MHTLAWIIVAFVAGTLPSPYLIALLARNGFFVGYGLSYSWPAVDPVNLPPSAFNVSVTC